MFLKLEMDGKSLLILPYEDNMTYKVSSSIGWTQRLKILKNKIFFELQPL